MLLPYAPATINIAAPLAMMVVKAIPTSPPQCTSASLRLLEAMSVPAAPAVAKNPTT